MSYDEDLADRIRELVAAEPGLTEKKILNHLSGGDLEMEWAEDGNIYMTGPAVEVFSGEIEI